MISDATPKLDLYADSVRFLKQFSEKKAVAGKLDKQSYKGLFEKLYKHCWDEEE